mmetsp:Transcript_3364/g.9634  ORF Transcript_3364/g.9634 Transcript_3364/m.9634 type:complete len:200 (+) Transcript_3364:178-777(+)
MRVVIVKDQSCISHRAHSETERWKPSEPACVSRVEVVQVNEKRGGPPPAFKAHAQVARVEEVVVSFIELSRGVAHDLELLHVRFGHARKVGHEGCEALRHREVRWKHGGGRVAHCSSVGATLDSGAAREVGLRGLDDGGRLLIREQVGEEAHPGHVGHLIHAHMAGDGFALGCHRHHVRTCPRPRLHAWRHLPPPGRAE